MKKWKQIVDFPTYEVSNAGEIRNVKTKQMLKPFVDGKGRYLQVTLCNKGKMKKALVHRLVAEYFVKNPKPDEFLEVNHIDYNIKNNNYENLEWTSRKGNMAHAFKKFSPVRNFRHCVLYVDKKNMGNFKSIDAACKYAKEHFNASYASLSKYRKVGNIEIIAEARTTIPEGSTPEDELLVEAQNS